MVFLDDIVRQLQERGYTINRPLAENPDAQTYVFLSDFTSDDAREQRVLKLTSLLSIGRGGDNSPTKRVEQGQREIGLLQSLDHPRIPAVRDTFTLRYRDSIDVNVLAIQYLNMPSIKERIDHGGVISEEEAVIALKDGLSALAHVHSKDIYHRDIKPSNILFDGTAAYLIDFNFSKQGRNGSSTVVDTYGYYPVDTYSGELHPSQDLVALGNTILAAMYGKDIANIRRT